MDKFMVLFFQFYFLKISTGSEVFMFLGIKSQIFARG